MKPHSFRAICRSEWQTPQKRISICTSVGVRLAPFERERLQRLVRRVGGITFRGKHVIDPLSLYSIFRLRYTECSGRRMTNRNINPAAPGTKAAWRRRIPILNSSFFRQPFPPSHWKKCRLGSRLTNLRTDVIISL